MGYRHVVFEGPRKVAVRPLDVGEAGPGETLVRTHLSGISSGTELLAYLGKLDPNLPLDETLPTGRTATFRYPFSYGYSAVGEVAASRHGSLSGTRVFAFRDHADAFVAREADLLPIEGLVETEATLFPLVETALQVSLEVDLEPAESVAVVGLGVLGVLVSMLLAERGLDVRAIEPRRDRRHTAEALGIRTLTPRGGAPGGRAVDQRPRDLPRGGGERVARGARLDDPHDGARGPCDRRLVVRHGARVAATRRRVPSTSAHAPQFAGLDDPGEAAGRWTIERRRKEAMALCHVLPLDRIPTRIMPVDRAAEAFEILASRQEGGPMHIVLDHS